MNMTVISYAMILFLHFTSLNANENAFFRAFSMPAISYDASAQKIEELAPSPRKASAEAIAAPFPSETHIFDPLPKTLHELYERNKRALKGHPIIYYQLSKVLRAKRSAQNLFKFCVYLKLFSHYGIGIVYEPMTPPSTTHKCIKNEPVCFPLPITTN